jgi:hypothetical protein
MAYIINKYDKSVLTTIADGTIDKTLDINLVGKYYAGYGETQNENFVFMLENFASDATSPPPKRITGQLWYDKTNNKIKVYNGAKFKVVGGAEIGATRPDNLSPGDFWFKSADNLLYVINSANDAILIGPQGIPNYPDTLLRSVIVKDTLNHDHAAIQALVNGTTVFFITTDPAFHLATINGATPPAGFQGAYDLLAKGVTFAYTDSNGITHDKLYQLWGTASNAMLLNGYDDTKFLKLADPRFTNKVYFADIGYQVGDELRVYIDSMGTPIIQNQVGGAMFFKTSVDAMKLVDFDILPGVSDQSNLGNALNRFDTIYGNEFTGNSASASTLLVDTVRTFPSIAATANTIAVRDVSADITAHLFKGIATSAYYADLAEKYLADADYAVGTVMMVGGEREVTASRLGCRAIGVISATPGVMMNSELEGGVYVALKGRVPVRYSGMVHKGDRLVAGNFGQATATIHPHPDTFAIALEDSDLYSDTIECVIL